MVTYQSGTPLYILPFDHRSSFVKMFGVEASTMTPVEKDMLKAYKLVIYNGFLAGLKLGVPKGAAAILTDEEFGEDVLRLASAADVMTAVSTEKSGQREFALEYGNEFGSHLDHYQPTFAKALLRYNPGEDAALNARQRKNLVQLVTYAKAHNTKFLIEPLIKATEAQLAEVGGDKARYDTEVRPKLTMQMMQEMQADGVEPDIWKIEGMKSAADYESVVAQAQADGRQAGVIVLGRGDNRESVEAWLRAGSKVKGVVGFAIGRTVFAEPLIDLHHKRCSTQEAVERIGQNYYHFYQVFAASV